MLNIIEKAKLEIKKIIKNYPEDPYHLWGHIEEVERWCNYLLKRNPSTDSEVVILSAWLHDIGHYPVYEKNDHAIVGEQRAKIFLENENYDREKQEKVLHCIRAHRNKDVAPNTLEAKIICFADTASHITSSESVYLDIVRRNKYYGEKYDVFEKMQRDFRDLDFFPEIRKELLPLQNSWVKLIEEYNKLNI